MDLISRDKTRAVFEWIEQAKPGENDLFVSILSLGQIAHTIEGMPGNQRNQWRRLLQEGRRQLEDAHSLVPIDIPIVDVWQSNLRGDHLADIPGAEEELGEDDRLILATSIARGYSLVTAGSTLISEVADRTSLTIVEL